MKNGTIRHEGHIEGLITHLTWFPQGNRLAISTTLVIANFLIIIDPYDDILYFVFASSHDIFGIDINSEGSQVVIEGSNTLTLLKIEYACPDIRNSISD